MFARHPNATAGGLTGAIVTVLAVISEDGFDYVPSSPAFWPAIATLCVAAVLFVGRR